MASLPPSSAAAEGDADYWKQRYAELERKFAELQKQAASSNANSSQQSYASPKVSKSSPNAPEPSSPLPNLPHMSLPPGAVSNGNQSPMYAHSMSPSQSQPAPIPFGSPMSPLGMKTERRRSMSRIASAALRRGSFVSALPPIPSANTLSPSHGALIGTNNIPAYSLGSSNSPKDSVLQMSPKQASHSPRQPSHSPKGSASTKTSMYSFDEVLGPQSPMQTARPPQTPVAATPSASAPTAPPQIVVSSPPPPQGQGSAASGQPASGVAGGSSAVGSTARPAPPVPPPLPRRNSSSKPAPMPGAAATLAAPPPPPPRTSFSGAPPTIPTAAQQQAVANALSPTSSQSSASAPSAASTPSTGGSGSKLETSGPKPESSEKPTQNSQASSESEAERVAKAKKEQSRPKRREPLTFNLGRVYGRLLAQQSGSDEDEDELDDEDEDDEYDESAFITGLYHFDESQDEDSSDTDGHTEGSAEQSDSGIIRKLPFPNVVRSASVDRIPPPGADTAPATELVVEIDPSLGTDAPELPGCEGTTTNKASTPDGSHGGGHHSPSTRSSPPAPGDSKDGGPMQTPSGGPVRVPPPRPRRGTRTLKSKGGQTPLSGPASAAAAMAAIENHLRGSDVLSLPPAAQGVYSSPYFGSTASVTSTRSAQETGPDNRPSDSASRRRPGAPPPIPSTAAKHDLQLHLQVIAQQVQLQQQQMQIANLQLQLQQAHQQLQQQQQQFEQEQQRLQQQQQQQQQQMPFFSRFFSPKSAPQPSPAHQPLTSGSSASGSGSTSLSTAPSSSTSSNTGSMTPQSNPNDNIYDVTLDRETTALPFVEDSPFFRQALSKQLSAVNAMNERLKTVAEQTNAFHRTLQAFARACRDLSHTLAEDWSTADMPTDLVNPYDVDEPVKNLEQLQAFLARKAADAQIPVLGRFNTASELTDEDVEFKRQVAASMGGLNAPMQALAALFASVENSLEHLGNMIDNSLHVAVSDYRNLYIKPIKKLVAAYESDAEAYESALERYLSKKAATSVAASVGSASAAALSASIIATSSSSSGTSSSSIQSPAAPTGSEAASTSAVTASRSSSNADGIEPRGSLTTPGSSGSGAFPAYGSMHTSHSSHGSPPQPFASALAGMVQSAGALVPVHPGEEERQQLAAARRAFELSRFDLIRAVNEARGLRRLQLVGTLLLSISAFNDFFHEGSMITDDARPFVEESSAALQRRIRHEHELMDSIAELRMRIERALSHPLPATMVIEQPIVPLYDFNPLALNVGAALRPHVTSSCGVVLDILIEYAKAHPASPPYVLDAINAVCRVYNTQPVDFNRSETPAPGKSQEPTALALPQRMMSAMGYLLEKTDAKTGLMPATAATFFELLQGAMYGPAGPGAVGGIAKAGYLRKQASRFGGGWQRRWFVLRGGQLVYYRDMRERAAHHVVDVVLCTVRIPPKAKAELDFIFEIVSPAKRIYTLQAQSDAERQEWIKAIQDCTACMLASLPAGHQSSSAEADYEGGNTGASDAFAATASPSRPLIATPGRSGRTRSGSLSGESGEPARLFALGSSPMAPPQPSQSVSGVTGMALFGNPAMGSGESLLDGSGDHLSSGPGSAMTASGHSRQMLAAVALNKLVTTNTTCADCGAERPDWACINHGTLICITCSGFHRSLGVHVSKVRSITLDNWELELLEFMNAMGNERFNSVYEAGLTEVQAQAQVAGLPLTGLRKPTARTSVEEREEFIRNKYVAKKFISAQLRSEFEAKGADDKQSALMAAIAEDDILQALRAIALGAQPAGVGYWSASSTLANAEPGTAVEGKMLRTTPLHVAVARGSIAMVEFLLQHGASPSATDEWNRTPHALAQGLNGPVKSRILDRLQRRG